MVEPKSAKKRSVGRPKTNKALQKLRVQTWFNAVAEASGKTAYELEKEFAPSTVDREDFNKQRARLWEKYRLGKTMPSINEKKGGKKGTAHLVEDKYLGTLKLLVDPIWTLADATAQVTMDDLKSFYLSLDSEVNELLLEDGDLANKLFWRKPCDDFERLLSNLSEKNSLSGFKGLLCLLREAILCQNKANFDKVIFAIKKISSSQQRKTIIEKLSKLVFKEFQER